MAEQRDAEAGNGTGANDYDVAIVGGGLAGLCLALQLKRARPETSIVVIEQREGEAPEAAFKVGESTVETSSHYFASVLGLRDHMEGAQNPKYGLRFLLPTADNSDLTRRVEVATAVGTPGIKSYQLDRGRFENELWRRAGAEGAEMVRGARAVELRLGAEGAAHEVVYERGGERSAASARWLIDAAGRAFLLKRQLGLEKDSGHHVNSSWFRLDGGLDLEQWGHDDADWMARMPEPGRRMYSTNHLMGKGYWVWLIPLASGPISIGVCADPRFHPWEELNTFDHLLEWMRRHEPQLAAAVEPRREDVLDFLKVEDFSYDCERVFSTERWCLTGDAGRFADPLYSPGSDFIAYANTFISDFVLKDLDGEDATDLVEFFNFLHGQLYAGRIANFRDQYEVMGHPQAMLAKLVLNAYFGLGIVVPLFARGKMTDLGFLGPNVAPLLARLGPLLARMEALFRDWARATEPAQVPGFLAMDEWKPPGVRLEDLAEDWDDETFARTLDENGRRVEALAVLIFDIAAREAGLPSIDEDTAIDPYAVGLDPERWQDDGLFDGEGVSLRDARAKLAGIDSALRLSAG